MKQYLPQFLSLGKDAGRSLLVFSSNGFSLTAAVVTNDGSDLTIEATAESANTEPKAALIDVMGKLTVSYDRLPQQAIMLHAHAIPAVIELGIDNVDKLKPEKMQELIRWEMEGQFSEVIPQGDIGWLLVARGFMSEADRDALVEQLHSENQERVGTTPLRFGEVAIREGYINREQLEHCLGIQDQMQLQDQRIVCGWTRLNSDEPSQWLVTAMSSAIRDQWVSAFRELGRGRVGKCDLLGFYPGLACAAGIINGIGRHGDAYILELHLPYMALLHYRGGSLRACHLRATSRQSPTYNDMTGLLYEAGVHEEAIVYVYQAHASRRHLREQMKEDNQFDFRFIDKEFAPVNENDNGLDVFKTIQFLGAARLYSDNHDNFITPVQGFDAAPVWYRRQGIRVAAMVLLVVAVAITVEVFYRLETRQLEAELAELEKDISNQEKLRDDARQSRKLEAELKQLKKQHQSLQQTKKTIESILVTRRDFIQRLLDIVVRNINDNIIINSITEPQWNRFVIDGWAFDQASVDYFSKGLSRDLSGWDMFISSNPSSIGQDFRGHSGYQFSFTIDSQQSDSSRQQTRANNRNQ